jgi:hypothetical protein
MVMRNRNEGIPDSHQTTEEALRKFEEVLKKFGGNCQEIVTGIGSGSSNDI